MTLMRKRKSHSDSSVPLRDFCLGLSKNLLHDILQQAQLDATRDVQTIVRRTEAEGLSFLTKTLPTLGKEIHLALLGHPLRVSCFKNKHKTAIPHFLGALLSKSFDQRGYVLEDADICVIKDVIQLCFTWYKLEVPLNESDEEAFLTKFCKTDFRLPSDFTHLGDPDTRLEPLILREARTLVERVLQKFDPFDIQPSHGPGAVATGETTDEKMKFSRIYDSIEKEYPFTEYFFLSESHLFDRWEQQYWGLDHVPSPTAKVILVPKDSRGPRLISAEPLEVQFIQQGLGRALVRHLEKHPLTHGMVNFKDQTINRRLAMQGSINGEWDTLDLSEASDRVSLALVDSLFSGTKLYKPLLATRSTHTRLPNGRVVKLRKFAPMGSALCFPVEALCFWALGAACQHVLNPSVSLKVAGRETYVYGDDIIVKSGRSSYLISMFHFFGLKINQKKSCTTGFFRESCGCDAYRGNDITPIKVKKLPPTKCTDGQAYVSYVAYANSFFQACYYRTAEYIENHIRLVYGPLPYSERDPHRIEQLRWTPKPWELDNPEGKSFEDSAPCLYVRTPVTGKEQLVRRSRWNRDLQRTEYSVLVPTPSCFTSKRVDCWSELFRHFIAELGTRPYLYTRRRRVNLKRRWVCLTH